jgi:hypothetical protein
MLHTEIIVCSATRTKHTKRFCGQNVYIFNVTMGGTASGPYMHKHIFLAAASEAEHHMTFLWRHFDARVLTLYCSAMVIGGAPCVNWTTMCCISIRLHHEVHDYKFCFTPSKATVFFLSVGRQGSRNVKHVTKIIWTLFFFESQSNCGINWPTF